MMVRALDVSVAVAVLCQLEVGSVEGEAGRLKAARPVVRIRSAMRALLEMAASMASRVERREMGGEERRAACREGRA